MNDYKNDFKNIVDFFETKGLKDKLYAGEELLYMYIGIINSASGGFIDSLESRAGVAANTFDTFIDEYTLEVGSVMAALLQDIAEIISSGDSQKIENEISQIAHDIMAFMGKDTLKCLQNLINHYQSEYKLFKSTTSHESEIAESFLLFEEDSQLLTLDTAKIANLGKEKEFVVIVMLLQEIFMIMSLVNMDEMSKGNMNDVLTQEEYEDEEFDIKEKMRTAIEQNKDQVLYEKADFAYSPTDKVVCNICHGFYAKSGIQRHVGACAKKYVESDKSADSSYLFKITDKYRTDYFLHVLISDKARLEHLDTFLRDIWLECCGHMSSFRQGRDELEMDEYVESLTHTKKTEYTYDFGSSTDLIIEFKKEFHGTQEHLIKLVARNAAIKVPCHRCEKKDAKYICTECLYGGDEVIFCEDCVKKHTKKYHDDEEYMISHFVNSPRTGVCAYGELEEEL